MLVSLLISADVTDSYGFNVLAAQLKHLQPKGVQVQQFHIFHKFNEYYPQPVIDDLVALCRKSDLVGISLLSSAFRNSTQITRELRKVTDCPIIWGGKHPSADPEDCLNHADMVCISEGEDTLLELVGNMVGGQPTDNVAGLWARKNGQVIRNPPRPLEMNLDRYLFPDYSLPNKFVLDTETVRVRPMEDRDLKDMRAWYPTMITRGCPHCCTFCSTSTDRRMRHMRARSIDNSLQEIKLWLKDHPRTRSVFLRDDCLSAMPLEWVRQLCQRWKQEIGLPVSLSGVTATSPDFQEKIRLMADAGFHSFKMGIQSGCERVRRFVYARGKETDDVIVKACRTLNRLCGKVNYYMITDNPYESEDELIQSIRFTSRLPRPFSLSLLSLNFYPGTALYVRALKDGHLKNKEDALQESTMDFKDTYLNRVFLSLRHLEVPPFLASILTNKRLYGNKWYLRVYNRLFHYLFGDDRPSRFVKAPRAPFKVAHTRNGFRYWRRPEVPLIAGWPRWALWNILWGACHVLHKMRRRQFPATPARAQAVKA